MVEDLLAKRRELAIKLLESSTFERGNAPRASRLAGVRSPFPVPLFGELKSEIVRLIHRIEACGCKVKDLDLGLIDFPSTRDGEDICLCWKAGEPSVAYWHPADEGFASRRPLDG